MNFWEQEQEKLKLWWEGVSKREIGTYFFGAIFLLFLVFIYYFALGITASRGAWGNASFSFS